MNAAEDEITEAIIQNERKKGQAAEEEGLKILRSVAEEASLKSE